MEDSPLLFLKIECPCLCLSASSGQWQQYQSRHRPGRHLQYQVFRFQGGREGIRIGRMERGFPGKALRRSRKRLGMGLPVSVHSQKYGVILRLPASAEQDSKLMGVRSGGVVPGNTVVHGDIRPAAGGGSACAPQDGMGFAEGDHPGDKRKEILIFGQILPVQPGNFIVLAVRVVVPELAAPLLQRRTAKAFFRIRSRSARTCGSSVGPSAPQFQL